MNRSTFDQWLRIVEAQLVAARKVDGKGLARLTRERLLLQDQLTLAGVVALSPADRAYAKEVTLKVRALDRRIRSCAQVVMDALAVVVPEASPTTYNARGYLRG
jgi:hypothetical protein